VQNYYIFFIYANFRVIFFVFSIFEGVSVENKERLKSQIYAFLRHSCYFPREARASARALRIIIGLQKEKGKNG